MNRTPNILVLMLDQATGTLFPDGPLNALHTPNLKRLAERSKRFSHCYTPSPLCVPARAAFMTGLLPSRTGVYDNAAEFPASIPTFAHNLRRAGYYTALSGKMHFVGPDQLHGFEERLTTDIYPADFGWTPDYQKPGERVDWWYHNLGSVTGAGVAETSNQLEFDDETGFHAEAELLRLARRLDDRPWCLTASFTHPHDPYVTRQRYWDLYENSDLLEPITAAIEFDEQDAHSKRLYLANDHTRFVITPEDIRRSRRAWLGNLSYLDEQIGKLLAILDRCGMTDHTHIVLCADHGDMLGERGLWFKMSFFEGSSRVPLMIAGPGIEAGLIDTPVSLLDVAPTLVDLASVNSSELPLSIDGESLLPLMNGGRRHTPVLMEYAAEGTVTPMVSIRDGRYKFNYCTEDPPQLFDLETDPAESTNLADHPDHSERFTAFLKDVHARWDLAQFDRDVRLSQARRHAVYEALVKGRQHPWDFEPNKRSHDRYMRNHMDLNVVESRARFPKEE
ncbi:MAG: choline-sulfatase [marine bacterium B5-7]|nr:MAG: choline-sulfatase [marine bacterium B5-7]